MVVDLVRWHNLLTSRYVCEACTTRLYSAYPVCPACHKAGTIRPLYSSLRRFARSDDEYREMIMAGQRPSDSARARFKDAVSVRPLRPVI